MTLSFNLYTIPTFCLKDKDLFVSNISSSTELFEKIYYGYHSTTNKYQDSYHYDNCKHDNITEFYVVRKILGYESGLNLDRIKQIDPNDFAKQYADLYFNFYMGLSLDTLKSLRFSGIFYGLEFSYGIEIYNKLNLLSKCSIDESRINYEKGIELLISNKVAKIDVESNDLTELEQLKDSLQTYWILWQKSPIQYEFYVNVEQT
jgi:hypothetical protein